MSTAWAQTAALSVKATCTTGSESAPSQATDGLSLETEGGVGGFAVHVEVTNDTNMTVGTLQAYLFNPISQAWNRAPDLDLTVPAGAKKYGFHGFRVPAPTGRIAYLPNSITQPCIVYINGTRRV